MEILFGAGMWCVRPYGFARWQQHNVSKRKNEKYQEKYEKVERMEWDYGWYQKGGRLNKNNQLPGKDIKDSWRVAKQGKSDILVR